MRYFCATLQPELSYGKEDRPLQAVLLFRSQPNARSRGSRPLALGRAEAGCLCLLFGLEVCVRLEAVVVRLTGDVVDSGAVAGDLALDLAAARRLGAALPLGALGGGSGHFDHLLNGIGAGAGGLCGAPLAVASTAALVVVPQATATSSVTAHAVFTCVAVTFAAV